MRPANDGNDEPRAARIAVDVKSDLPRVCAEEKHLTRMIAELLWNCVNTADDVTVRAYREEEATKIAVTANNADGSIHARSDFLKAFSVKEASPGDVQVSVPPPRTGSGLGLTRVYISARSMGANVLVSNTTEGDTSLIIEFPESDDR